jgi:hypothetical protein
VVGFSVAAPVSDRAQVFASYDGEVGGGTVNHAATVGFRLIWWDKVSVRSVGQHRRRLKTSSSTSHLSRSSGVNFHISFPGKDTEFQAPSSGRAFICRGEAAPSQQRSFRRHDARHSFAVEQ